MALLTASSCDPAQEPASSEVGPAILCDLGSVVPCSSPARRSMLPIEGILQYSLHQMLYSAAMPCPAGTQVSFPRQQPRGSACGALGTQMNLFSRLFRVARSYANALGVHHSASSVVPAHACMQPHPGADGVPRKPLAVNSVEDPEKMLDQTVTEMQNDLIKMRQASAQVPPGRAWPPAAPCVSV